MEHVNPVASRALSAGSPVLHWLANERQGPFPCSVPLVLRAHLHIFAIKNQPLLPGRPFLALKRKLKRPCWLQTYTFPMKNQCFHGKINNLRSERQGPQERSHAAWRSEFDSHAAWEWFLGRGVALGEPQESSHAAWRSKIDSHAAWEWLLGCGGGARRAPGKLPCDVALKI